MSHLTPPLGSPVLLPFSPDWRRGVLDEWEWMTGVIASRDGTEQRSRLRSMPRRYFTYSVMVHERSMRSFDGYMYAARHLEVGIPLWFDRHVLISQISAGAGSLSIDTTDKDYHVGGHILFWADWHTWELMEIDAVTDTDVTFVGTTASAWWPGVEVYPVRTCRLQDEVPLERVTGDVLRATFEATATDFTHRYNAVELPDSHKGYPVLLDQSNWFDTQSETVSSQQSIIDFKTGPIAVDTRSVFPTMNRSFEWFLKDRAAVKVHREFLMAREGRRKALWAPTWCNDLSVGEALTAGGTVLKVIDDDYQAYYSVNNGKRDLFVMRKDGQVGWDRVLLGVRVGDYQELTLETGLAFDVDPTNVKYLSFMGVHRLTEDRVGYLWRSPTAAQVRTNMRLLDE